MKVLVKAAIFGLFGMMLTSCATETSDSGNSGKAGDSGAAAPSNSVIVYYMHRTYRCPACREMEEMAHYVVQDKFANELASGKVQWQVLNYQEHEDIAERYELNTSSLVLVSYRDGKEVSHEVLEETWNLYKKPDEFEAYVAGAIRDRLDKAN